ncbi:MAG: protein-L-isoaspartate(D-aspartate) O-methyltransferase [Gammaproteobacteria bacterium]|nr:protein-L-isoaspartate(D-aspartate) O-methyltransferase [Gammaproteobacteria bacterium]
MTTESMLRDIAAEQSCTREQTGKDALDVRVLQAMANVPRHEFVPEESRSLAYHNGPLPIGCGQTISQPYIVALMTDLLDPQPGDVILEIGTGSGYQAAILSQLVKQVYSVEIVAALAQQSTERLQRLGYKNVTVRHADGYQGWPEHAPYDGIIVTAAAPHIPAPLLAQLKPGARMVIPVGMPHAYQELIVVEKDADNNINTRSLIGVAFVPLTGNH